MPITSTQTIDLESQTSDFTSEAIDTQSATFFDSILHVYAVITEGTLDCKIQHSPDSLNWYDTGVAFTQKTNATGSERKSLPNGNFQRFVRFVVSIGGGGNYSYMIHQTSRA